MLECLQLRPQFLAFETALRRRSEELARLDDERFARVRGFENSGGGLVVVSELVTGHRLIDILETRHEEETAVSGIDAAFGFLLQGMPALAELHASSVTHGAVAPGRVLITPNSQVVLLDCIYGSAVERLNLSRSRLWSTFGIVAPPFAGRMAIDPGTDVAQMALCGLLLAAGRPPHAVAHIAALAPLVREVVELAEIRAGARFAEGVARFFAATLPAEGRQQSIASEVAASEIRALVGHISEDESLEALAQMVSFAPKPSAPPYAGHLLVQPLQGADAAEISGSRDFEEVEDPLPASPVVSPDAVTPTPAAIPSPVSPALAAVTPVRLRLVEPAAMPELVGQPAPSPPVPAPAVEPAAAAQPPVPVRIEPPRMPVFAAQPVPPRFVPSPAGVFSPAVTAPAHEPVVPAPAPPTPVIGVRKDPLPVPPTPIAIKQQPPTGFAPLRQGGSLATPAPSREPGLAFGFGGAAKRRGVPWKLAAAAALLVSLGFFGARPYLKGNPDSNKQTAAASGPAGAPASTVAARHGSVAIESQPDGARVTLDGKEVGVTPLTLDGISVGRHQLSLTAGTATVQRTIQVEADKQARVSVPVFSGFLAVFAPIRLEISAGRRSLGSTESGRILMSPGRHVLTLTNSELGFTLSQAVEIQPGQERVLNLKPTGRVNLNASPWAEVWVDGARAGETPLANLEVPLGTREFVFKHPQHGERRLTATVTTSPSALTVDFGRPPSNP